MSTTPHLGLALVAQSQAQKEVTVNQALTQIDALLNTGAKSMTTSTPPSSPAAGDVYIVGPSPTGAWAGQAGNIATFSQAWNFLIPNAGMTLWVNDLGALYAYNGAGWASANLLSINNVSGATTLSSSAFGQLVRATGASSYAITLPAHSAGKIIEFSFQTSNGALVTLIPASGAIDGRASKVYGAYEGCLIYDDGTNYFTLRERLQPVSFLANAASVSVPSSTATKIPFNSAVFDTGGFFDATTNYRYTPQYPGLYSVSASLLYNGIGSTGEFDTRIYKNGSLLFQAYINTAATFTSDTILAAGAVEMNGTTDYLEVFGYQTSGSAVTTQALSAAVYFTAHRVGNF